MKLLFWHADYIKVKPLKEALKEKDEKIEIEEFNEPLVVLLSIEKGDEKYVDFIIKEILEVYEKVGARSIVLYPYAHLSSNLEKPSKAREILNKIFLELCKKVDYVKKAPFGWYKQFEIKIKGHPLSELSKTINENYIKEKEKKNKEKEKVEKGRFVVIDEKGKELDIEEVVELVNKGVFNEELKTLIEKEVMKKETSKKIDINYNEVFKKFGFEWEELSDSGHMRYGPKAAIMYDLAVDYIRQQIFKEGLKAGIKVFEIKGTNLFSLEHEAIRTHTQLFGERMYTIETDKREHVLRYAACFQQFAMVKDWNLSYKHLPFGMLEIADSYRYEQRGEVELLFRLRKFVMPDWHIFCKDEEEGKKYMFKIHEIIMNEMENKIGKSYWLLVNVSNEEIYIKYKEYLKKIASNIKRPIVVYIYPPEDKRYWTINIEYNIIDNKNKVREIGTVQIDIGNWKRFNITYKDESGNEKGVVIIHTAILGTVERFLYAIFDKTLERKIKEKKKPVLPLWISPIQVRIIPVSNEFLNKAKEILEKLKENNIRVDLDDRDLRIGKKIAEAEKEWINYIVIIGEKEIEENKITVRDRENEREVEMSIEKLINIIKEKTKDYPFVPLRMPELLSERPSF